MICFDDGLKIDKVLFNEELKQYPAYFSNVFNPDFFKEQLPVFIGLLLLFITQVSLAFFRYGKMTTFHTYGAKIAAVAQGSFLILLFFTPEPLTILFYIAAFITAAELIEEILIVLVLPRWEANVKGLFWVLKRRPNL